MYACMPFFVYPFPRHAFIAYVSGYSRIKYKAVLNVTGNSKNYISNNRVDLWQWYIDTVESLLHCSSLYFFIQHYTNIKQFIYILRQGLTV